jgi:enoyl-CoA hydratase/carnithine racemase
MMTMSVATSDIPQGSEGAVVDEVAQPIRLRREGPVGHIVMARPEKRNSLSAVMRNLMCGYLRELDRDPDIDVVVISGDGPAFSAGGDLREHGPDAMTFEQAWTMLASGVDLVESIEAISKIVVARVQGPAHAGGLLLSLCADITVAASTSRFRCPELLRARPDPFIPFRLVSKVGREKAADLMYTAREIDGIEAERIGLVARCVDEDQLDAELDSLIADVLRTDRTSRAVWKRMLRGARPTANAWEFADFFTSGQTAERSYNFRR